MKNLVAIFIAALAIYACSPARKLQKAEQMVIYNPQSFDKIGQRWAELNFHANDTFIVDNPIDSLTFADYLAFLANPPRPDRFKVDSLPQYLKDAYYLGYSDASIKLSAVKIPKCPPTSQKVVVVDRKIQNLYKDSINRLNVQKASINGQLGQLNIELSKQAKKLNGWIWLFVGATTLFVLTLVLSLAGFIKRLIP